MKRYSRFITLTGGFLAFFGFALPWKHIYSGAVLANAKGWLNTIAFLASLTIFGISFYLLNRKALGNARLIVLALILSALGIFCCVVTFLQLFEYGINFITISFIASLVIISTTIYMLNRQTPQESLLTLIILISSGVGLCCFLILFFTGSFVVGSGNRIDNTQYGAFLTAIGYMLVLVSLLCCPQTEDSSGSINEEDDKIEPQGDEK